jgi:C4-dicarboxylate-specific signal transduction histidine kinase
MAFNRFVWVLVAVLCIICDARCKSHPIREQVTQQAQANNEAADIAEATIQDPAKRAVVVSALRTSAKLLKETDQQRASAEAAREAAESDARSWRYLKYSLYAALIFGGIYWLKRKLL